MSVRALIAEDEPILAATLTAALARLWPELSIVATCANGIDAVREATALKPEVLFLDIKMPGQTGLEAAEETTRLATSDRLRPEGLVSFGLGGPEIGVPRPQFKPYFDRAIAAGLRSVPHAGETTGPETVWDALTYLRAERIGHGTSSAQDEKLLAHLAEHRIALEVCPTSNIATRAVRTLD